MTDLERIQFSKESVATDELCRLARNLTHLSLRRGMDRLNDRDMPERSSGARVPVSATATYLMILDIVEGMIGQVAVADSQWNIVVTNAAWLEAMVSVDPEARLYVGDNFRQWGQRADFTKAQPLLAGLAGMDAGDIRQVSVKCLSSQPPSSYVHLLISRMDVDGVPYATIARCDMTELHELRRQRLELGAHLLRSQEDERHRVARELHDSVGQFMVALRTSLMGLQQGALAPDATDIVLQLNDTLDDFNRDVRSMTYLLHPPPLHPDGLYSTVEMMCRGFARRSGLDVTLGAFGEGRARSVLAETTIYRIVQEAFSNIYKHARATRVRVRLATSGDQQCLIIADDGIGLHRSCGDVPAEICIGVGIAGMIERLEHLGGCLLVRDRKGAAGVIVAATLPLDAHFDEDSY